jgi:Flp pilus assembly protein TadG
MRQEHGAVAVMVAILLVVLLGMLALVIDLGRAVGIRREMVNAADAAALAAAQQCALNRGPASAIAAANETATLNDPAAGPVAIEIDPECVPGAVSSTDPKTVTVTYSRTVDYFVAPILGFDSGTVTTSATAIWGAATRAAPIPLRINLVKLAQCQINPGQLPGGQTCRIGFGNNFPSGSDSNWGWLNFRPDGSGWNVDDPSRGCNSQAGGTGGPVDFISGASSLDAALRQPPPTWVCSYSGNPQNVVSTLKAREDDILTFPVVQGDPFVVGGAIKAWPVVGFVALRVVHVYEQQEDPEQYCPELLEQQGRDNFCLELRYDGTVPGGGPAGDAIYFNVPAVRLVE